MIFIIMKFNEKELAEASNGPADIEGRLNHKRAHKSGFKEKWFKLRCNLLFYFNINELGQIDTRQPAGVIILENYSINLDAATEGVFAFSIAFRDEYEKRHVLSGRSELQVEQWVNALKQASYEYWRFRLIVLQEKLCKKTGKDPLLMYPRNQGIIRDEAWEPASTFRSHVSWTEDVKKARSGDYNIKLYDDERYAAIRKALRNGEDPNSVKPLVVVVLNNPGIYRGPWINSELLAVLLAALVSYSAFSSKFKLLA